MSVERGGYLENPNPQNLSQANLLNNRENPMHHVMELSEIVINSVEPQFAPDFKRIYAETMKNQNVFPMLLLSHQSHTDLLVLMKLAKELTGISNQTRDDEHKFPGFDLLIASTLKEGAQGAFLRDGINQVQDFLSRFSITPIEYMRDKDRQYHNNFLRENGKKELSEKELDVLQHGINLSSSRSLYKHLLAGKGVALFPEATVQGGRLKEDGTIYGMQKLDCECAKFDKLAELAKANGKKPILIFAGIDGGYKIVSPDTTKPTPEAYRILQTKQMPKDLVRVKISNPIDWDEVLVKIQQPNGKIENERLEDFVGTELAKQLPAHARGYYSNFIR